MTPRRRQRAYATALAVILLGFLGITAAALALVLRADMTRTQSALHDPQARQFLRVGATVAQSRLESTNFTQNHPPQAIPTPVGTLTWQLLTRTPTTATVQVTARINTHQASQILKYEKQNTTWTPTQATLLTPTTVSQNHPKSPEIAPPSPPAKTP